MDRQQMSQRERLVFHVQELERVEDLKKRAAECVKESFEAAATDGFDKDTLKVVLKLRRMTPEQRRDRRALEAIYMAALGMLDGEALPDEARRRLDPPPAPPREPNAKQDDAPQQDDHTTADAPDSATEPPPAQPPLILKTPDEARQEGMDAAAAGKRIYDNPYPAGDPCRAAWDEGWCAQSRSHGMDTPAAYQRRSSKPPEKDDKPDKDGKMGDGDQEAA
jgi:uncharacterized protein (UPF0335 family)